MQGKGKSMYIDRMEEQRRRRRQIRNWVILLVLIMLVLVGIRFIGNMGGTTEMGANRLTCFASQSVTPFGNNILYYDDASIHCLSSDGGIRWSFPVGSGASFTASDDYLVIWQGSQVYIVNQSGNATYNDNMTSEVQFARVGQQYVAVATGSDTATHLVVLDMKGSQVDEEREAFEDMLLLDVGFYGDQGQYMWTLAMDVYGTAINSTMNTFQVGKMSTGEVSVGEKLAYKVLSENNKLRVFTTQQLYTYNYKAVQDTNSTILVYGWKLIDYDVPDRGDAKLLLAPTSQTSNSQQISDLRLLTGTDDRRFALPDVCVGAMVRGQSVYGFSGSYMYRSDVTTQKFYAYALPIGDGETVTAYLGTLKNGRVLLACDETVYAVTLPE